MHKNFMIGILLVVWIMAGCTETKIEHRDEYLIRVGTSVATIHDFNNALDIARTAYPNDIADDPVAFRAIKSEVFKQISERLILLERARELLIWISDPEIEAVITETKSGYPEGEFEKTLLESAISYDFWKKELRARLIMEKVVARELGKRIVITPEDIAAYHEENKDADGSGANANSEKMSKERVTKQVYREKSEKAYQSWIRELGEKYEIDINRAKWEELTGS